MSKGGVGDAGDRFSIFEQSPISWMHIAKAVTPISELANQKKDMKIWREKYGGIQSLCCPGAS